MVCVSERVKGTREKGCSGCRQVKGSGSTKGNCRRVAIGKAWTVREESQGACVCFESAGEREGRARGSGGRDSEGCEAK
jgi:hypothetical protein